MENLIAGENVTFATKIQVRDTAPIRLQEFLRPKRAAAENAQKHKVFPIIVSVLACKKTRGTSIIAGALLKSFADSLRTYSLDDAFNTYRHESNRSDCVAGSEHSACETLTHYRVQLD